MPIRDAVECRTATFEREQPHLLSTAFRILGSQPDAEDAVQEAWIAFNREDPNEIENAAAWLTTVTTRLCLDSLRRRRRIQPGSLATRPDDNRGPLETALLADELTSAFTIILGELTPPQRVALVLHDAFGLPFEEVGRILGSTPGSAKKLASRARGRIRRHAVAPVDDVAKARTVVEAFLQAAQEGDTQRLVTLLHPHVVRTADPHVVPPHGLLRIQGARAVAHHARFFQANARRARIALIGGRPGIVVPGRGASLEAALVMHVRNGRIRHYDVVADPRRLALLEVS
ncbi:MAG TPA: sigma-70 family RNA polymerase sigma factor [Candidatus Acidoferrales bacterium]|nr:sigma-70 family RNA polymerase sigma factor [Candidatus Acidoferrales bacterium]